MGVMVLHIVVLPPGLMGLVDLRPGACVGERMVSEPALDRKQGLCVIFPGLARINALLMDIQHVIELDSDR